MIAILPAILATNEQIFKEQFNKVTKSPSFQEGWIHLDLMDNKFVPNQSLSLDIIAKYHTTLKKEIHLMVMEPSSWVDETLKIKPDRLICHIETGIDQVGQFIQKVRAQNLQVGLSINSDTSLDLLAPFIGKIDCVLLMSVIPGFQGQPFIPKTLESVRQIKKRGWKVKIGLDGGIKLDNIKEVVDSGVDYVTMGSGLLKGDIDENLEHIWETLEI